MTDFQLILDKAKESELSNFELSIVLEELASPSPEADLYTLLHIVGRAGDPRFEELVSPYLDARHDPMLV